MTKTKYVSEPGFGEVDIENVWISNPEDGDLCVEFTFNNFRYKFKAKRAHLAEHRFPKE